MDKVKIIKELNNKKILLYDINRENEVGKINNKLYRLKEMVRDDARKNIDLDNKYKTYIKENRNKIKASLGINAVVDSIKEAIKLLNSVDFKELYGMDFALKERFECEFFSNIKYVETIGGTKVEAIEAVQKRFNLYGYNDELDIITYERLGNWVAKGVMEQGKMLAWIDYNTINRKYEYCVKMDENNEYIERFGVVDFYQIIMKCDMITAVRELCDLLEITIEYIEKNRDKYMKNLNIIRNKEYIETKYPILYKYLGKHINTLEVLIEEGMNKLFWHNENNSFSCSYRYLANMVGKKANTISPVLNSFVLLGLVFKDNTNEGKGNKVSFQNDITYYILPEYTEEIFNHAEYIAKVLLEEGEKITISNFNYKICCEKFGEEIANKIFTDKKLIRAS